MTPVTSIGAVGLEAATSILTTPPPAVAPQAPSTTFTDMLGKGLDGVEQKLNDADKMVRAFALDDSVPIHQVTIALEEARIAVELAMQVRSHLVEAYRQIMNTQL